MDYIDTKLNIRFILVVM